MHTYLVTAKRDLKHLQGLLVNANSKAQTVKLMGMIADVKSQIQAYKVFHNVQ